MNPTTAEKKLMEKKFEILQRVNKIEADKRANTRGDEQSYEDHAQNLDNVEVLNQLGEIERSELNLIDAALDRIKTGQFGKCESCGQQIGEARLMAVPYTGQCINCANEK